MEVRALPPVVAAKSDLTAVDADHYVAAVVHRMIYRFVQTHQILLNNNGRVVGVLPFAVKYVPGSSKGGPLLKYVKFYSLILGCYYA